MLVVLVVLKEAFLISCRNNNVWKGKLSLILLCKDASSFIQRKILLRSRNTAVIIEESKWGTDLFTALRESKREAVSFEDNRKYMVGKTSSSKSRFIICCCSISYAEKTIFILNKLQKLTDFLIFSIKNVCYVLFLSSQTIFKSSLGP